MKLDIINLKNKDGLLREDDRFKVPLFWLDSKLGGKPDAVKKAWLENRKSGLKETDLSEFRKAITTGEFKGTIEDPSLAEVYLDGVLECMHSAWGTKFEEVKR